MSRATRRAHTRWLLLGPLAALALIVAAAWGLERAHPQLDEDLLVEAVPPLALEDTQTCTRQADDGTIDAIRRELPVGGRVSSGQVVACPLAFDGAFVLFAGEVVGELLPRDGGAWAQVNDDAYALEVGPVLGHREHAGFNSGLAVWLPDAVAEQITTVGRPGVRGDVVLLAGQIHRADPDDGGGLTLRAARMQRLADGVEIETPLHVVQVAAAAALAVVALACGLWARRVRRR
jgi:hypothetical protein